MMHGDASLWESFHRRWRDELAPGDTLGLRAPFQDLRLAPSQEHALRYAPSWPSLPRLVIRGRCRGGVPENLSEDNLSTWADTVQDVATGMIVLQPGTDQIIFPHLVELLTLWSRCHGWHSVASVTFRAPPAGAWRLVPLLQLHPLRDCRGVKLQIQPSAPTRRRLGEALDRRFHMDLHPCQAAPFGICLLRITQDSWGIFCYSPTPPPAGRASFLESQLMAIRHGLTAPPEPLRLPQPTWMPPATQNRRRTQLPPPPPRTDSVSTTDQSQQTTAPDTGPEGQGTRRTGRSRSRSRHHGPVSSPSRQSYTSLQASGRSGGTSRRAPDWNPLANLRTTVVGLEKRLGLLHGSLLQAQLQE